MKSVKVSTIYPYFMSIEVLNCDIYTFCLKFHPFHVAVVNTMIIDFYAQKSHGSPYLYEICICH